MPAISNKLIAQRLKEAMGLHSETVGMITISSAVEQRMRKTGINSPGEYLKILDSQTEEIQHLIETVIIPETWFFRDEPAYERLLQYIQAHYPLDNANVPPALRILSVPCSSGEEAYSIAMLLHDHGYNPDQVSIDAIDISQTLIDKAIQGIYRQHSFRGNNTKFRGRHFSANGDDYLIKKEIKSYVNFTQGNMLAKDFYPGHEIYNIIFCRNLLIYFDTETQAEVFSILNRLLKKDGILVLGHAETSHKSLGLFSQDNELGAYINRKSSSPGLETTGKNKKYFTKKHKKKIHNKTLHTNLKNPGPAIPARKKQSATISKDNEALLEKAFVLANKGELDKAMQIVSKHLGEDRFSSRGYYLMGLIHDADGNFEQARASMKKAIYLNPDNIEALIHLSLMAEQRGDISESERMRDRAERAQNRRDK
ncbi:CheR family methyltransferase [Sulfuriflexus mobilis]|uniref:CheR family methyltransferase n=1 Tax=Sulfuriflexus mobilis TaxID=1811807 RepID=UPI000F82FE51|nr:protein-glutamate O-methyltransferase CheR [Sulfuriflexus mobilis]